MSAHMPIVTGVRFFLKNHTAVRLQERSAPCFGRQADFIFELIDLPIRCRLVSEESYARVQLYVRSELGYYDDNFSDMSLTVFADGSAPYLTNNERIDGNPEVLSNRLLQTGCSLRDTVSELQLMEDFAGMDREAEGVMVKQLGDRLHFERVSGRKRPSMLCRTLFGGEQMVRPYADEAFNPWMTAVTIDSLLADAEAGDEDAMEQVARAYLKGNYELQTERDGDKAAYWLQKLAAENNGWAQLELALLYMQGSGVPQDLTRALELLEQAKSNSEENAYVYGEVCRRLVDVKKHADSGDRTAMAALAWEYLNLGMSLDEDNGFYELSLAPAMEAAEADEPEAMWVLGQLYEYGLGVTEQFEQALECYRRGSELGHGACQHALGLLYLQGDYLIADVDKGFNLCLQAAQQNYGPAMKTIGSCYQFGDGVESSMKTALEWFEKYLELYDDPEFEEQVAYFKTIPGLSEDGGMDIQIDLREMMEPREEEDDFDFGSVMGFQSDSIAAMVAFSDGEEYELELLGQGILPDAPTPDSADSLRADAFPRVQLKAAEGDPRAAEILATIAHVTGMDGF